MSEFPDTPTSADEVVILLVDDEPAITEVIGMRLTKLGYRVHSVANGAEALDWLRDHRPALVVSDVNMPLVGGVELCRTMASDPSTVEIPVLLLTAQSGELDLGELANLRGVLRKPFSVAQIVTKSVDLLGSAPKATERMADQPRVI